MDFNLVTLLCSLLIALGVATTIIPVLPGSLIVALSLLWWAISENETTSWVIFGIGTALVALGGAMQYLLTGRSLKRRQIPPVSIIVGVLTGVVMMFFVPLFGLPLGFVLGLFVMEYLRQKNFSLALSSSVAAIKATGLGILVEFSLASLAATLFFATLLFSRVV